MKTTSPHKHTEAAARQRRSGDGIKGATWSSAITRTLVHVTGVLSVSLLVSWFLSDASVVKLLLFEATGSGQLDAPYTQGILLHVLYSAGIWGALVLTYALIKRRARPTHTKPRVVRLARGQVMVETLLVITPFLLLTGGLSQLIVNNIAGMLSHLSAYQAGRTYWVWAQEHERDGASVGPETACMRARLAAAAVLTPVASGPSTFGGDTQFNRLSGIMAAHFSDQSNAPTGSSQSVMADPAINPDTFAKAFDSSPFSKRASQKLRAAYENTDVDCSPGNPFTVQVTYDHFLAFPWFGYIFETPSKPGYTRFTRSYQLPLQVPPQ